MITIRLAKESDWADLVEIYNQAVAMGNATADISPVSIASREDWFKAHTEDKYPIYVEETAGKIAGWCSISPYRAGRDALRFSAEISYYVAEHFRRQGVASRLIRHAIDDCSRLGIKNLFGILLDTNLASLALLEKFGFQEWGHLPNVADFNGRECGHLYLGKRVG